MDKKRPSGTAYEKLQFYNLAFCVSVGTAHLKQVCFRGWRLYHETELQKSQGSTLSLLSASKSIQVST